MIAGKDINQNCDTCQHKTNTQGEWCYMFEVKPKYECQIHTEEIEEKVKNAQEYFNKVAE